MFGLVDEESHGLDEGNKIFEFAEASPLAMTTI